jgi:carbon starvation protein CstA
MESFSRLFKKENMGELVLIILLIVYLILGLKTPEPLASMIDSMGGKIVMFVVVIYLFMNAHPILAVLSLLAAFDLMRRSSMTTGIAALQKFAPSEEKKMSQFTAYNQFPYTLEQEVVSKMAPIMKSGYSITPASFKPLLDNTYDASPINK